MRRIGIAGLAVLVACSGSEDAGGGSDPTASPSPSPTATGTTPGPGTSPPAPAEAPTPVAVAKTLELVPGTTITATLEAQDATNPTFEIVTPPTKGAVAWIDANKGELVYRPASLDGAVGDELAYVVKAGGKTSAPAKVTITSKALDFTTAPLVLRGAKESWYSYNLSINFNNAGSSDCGDPQQLTITGGQLLERKWACGTYPAIAVTVGAGSVKGGTSTAGGSFRRVSIKRRQFDARLEYLEESTDCSSYNSTLNSCNAGMSASTKGAVSFGPAPTTTTAPVLRPTTCETTGTTICDGIFAATDAEGDVLSFEMTQPANGSAAPNVDMKGFAYKAKPGFVGTDTFTVTASDGTAKSAPVTIRVVVK